MLSLTPPRLHAGGRSGRARRAGASALLVPLALVLFAGGLRLVELGQVERMHFDEKYYANDAGDFVDHGVEQKRPAHPPVGKLLIAVSIIALGDGPLGWRVAPALAGTLTVLAVYAVGLLLFRRRAPAALAAVLVALDGLSITMSRIAMLDVFLALFVMVALALVLLEGRWREAGRAGWGWPLWAAGASLGLAVATKWSGAFALAGVLLVAAVPELRRRRAAGAPWSRALVGGSLAVGLPLVAAASVGYVISYTPFLVNYTESSVYRRRCPEETCAAPLTERVAGLAFHHADVARMHRELPTTHPDRSAAITWPIMHRPVLAYAEGCSEEGAASGECDHPGRVERILLLGNPGLWWLALATVPLTVVLAVRRRDPAAAVVVGMIAAQLLPWLVRGSPGYLFYMLPVVPFLALSVALVVTRAARRPSLRWAPVAAVAASALGFAWLAPAWYALPLTPTQKELVLPFDSWA